MNAKTRCFLIHHSAFIIHSLLLMLRAVLISVGIVLAACGGVFLAPFDSFVVSETTGRVREISHAGGTVSSVLMSRCRGRLCVPRRPPPARLRHALDVFSRATLLCASSPP